MSVDGLFLALGWYDIKLRSENGHCHKCKSFILFSILNRKKENKFSHPQLSGLTCAPFQERFHWVRAASLDCLVFGKHHAKQRKQSFSHLTQKVVLFILDAFIHLSNSLQSTLLYFMYCSIICMHSNLPLKVNILLPFKNAQLRIFIWRMHVATFLPSLQMTYNQKQSQPHIWVYHSSFSIWADHIKFSQRLALGRLFHWSIWEMQTKRNMNKANWYSHDILKCILQALCRDSFFPVSSVVYRGN